MKMFILGSGILNLRLMLLLISQIYFIYYLLDFFSLKILSKKRKREKRASYSG